MTQVYPCRAVLDRWQTTSDARKYELRIQIQDDQIDAAKALLQHAYSGQLPADSDTSPSRLFQICTLADQEEMVAAQQAACLAMAALSPMPQEVVCWVFSEPLPGLPGTDAFKQLQQKAAEALQQRYGDLEKVLSTTELCTTFKQLPFKAVLALLQHEGTAVGGEGAVCLAVKRWLDARAEGEISQEQLRQLAAEVRFAGMSPGYRYHNLPSMAWLVEDAMEPKELLRVQGYFQLPKQQQQAIRWGEVESEQQVKAWVQRPPRPKSNYPSSIEIEVSIQQIDANKQQNTVVTSAHGVWGGMTFLLAVTTICFLNPNGNPSTIGVALCMFLQHGLKGPGPGPACIGPGVACAGFAVDIECLTGPAGPRKLQWAWTTGGRAEGAVTLAYMQGWERGKLQQHATDNTMRFRATLMKAEL